MGITSIWRQLLGLSLIVMMLISFSAEAQVNISAFERFRNALIDYFKKQNYVPVLVNRGYAVGDVVDVDGVNFYARSARCFPGLRLSAPEHTAFAELIETDAAELSFGLRLKQLFSSSAAVALSKQIRIRFSDLTVISASRLDMKEALDRAACSELIPLLEGGSTTVDPTQKPYFIVSEVVSGKREAMLRLATEADAQAQVDQIGRLIGDAKIQVKVGENGLVMLQSEIVSPVAMRPLTVPNIVTVAGSDVRGPELVLNWSPEECTSAEHCAILFESFSDIVKKTRVRLSPSEMNQ